MKQVFLKAVMLGVLTASALCLSPGSPLLAQDEELAQLRQKVSQLESRVKELEALLETCREGLKNHPSGEMAWQNKKNWRSLKAGMSEDQVKSILGEPVKVIKGVKILWYYPNIYGGNVSFDEKGRLTGWNEP